MKSAVWIYFDVQIEDEGKAICRICQAVVTRGIKFSTSPLLNHLRFKHGLEQKTITEDSIEELDRLAQIMDKDFLTNAIRTKDPRVELVARGGNVKSPVWRTFLVILFNGHKTTHIACSLCYQVYRYDSHHMGTSNLYRHKCVHLKLKDEPLGGATSNAVAVLPEVLDDDDDVNSTAPRHPTPTPSPKFNLGDCEPPDNPFPVGSHYGWKATTIVSPAAARQRENRNMRRRMNYYNRRSVGSQFGFPATLGLHRAIGQSMLLHQMRALDQQKNDLPQPCSSDNVADASGGGDDFFQYLTSIDATGLAKDQTEELRSHLLPDVPTEASPQEICPDNFVDDSLSDIDKSFKFWRKITNLGLLPDFINEIKGFLDEVQDIMVRNNTEDTNSNHDSGDEEYTQLLDHARRLSYVVTELRLTPRLKDKLASHQNSVLVEQERNGRELMALKRKLEMQEIRQEELQRKTQCFDDLMKQQGVLLTDPQKFKDHTIDSLSVTDEEDDAAPQPVPDSLVIHPFAPPAHPSPVIRGDVLDMLENSIQTVAFNGIGTYPAPDKVYPISSPNHFTLPPVSTTSPAPGSGTNHDAMESRDSITAVADGPSLGSETCAQGHARGMEHSETGQGGSHSLGSPCLGLVPDDFYYPSSSSLSNEHSGVIVNGCHVDKGGIGGGGTTENNIFECSYTMDRSSDREIT